MEKSKKKLIGIIAAVVAVILVIVGVVAVVFLTKDKDDDKDSKPKTEEVDKNKEEEKTDAPTEAPTEAPTVAEKTLAGKWVATIKEPTEDGSEIELTAYFVFSEDGKMKIEFDTEKLAETYTTAYTDMFKAEAEAAGVSADEYAKQSGYTDMDAMVKEAVDMTVNIMGAMSMEGTWEKVSDTEINTVMMEDEETLTYKLDGDKLSLTGEDGEVINLTRA